MFKKKSIALFNYFKPKFQFAQLQRKVYNSSAPVYSVPDAMKFAQIHSVANFDESFDFHLILNVDPKRGDHLIRGSCPFPAGLGKKIVVAVHCEPYLQEKAKAAGADIIVDQDFFTKIKEYKFDFDKFLCTNGCSGELKQYAKILGPRGLMPNVKTGTVISESVLEETIRQSKVGSIEYRVDPAGGMHVSLGKVSFKSHDLLRNLKSFMEAISEKKPEKIKGKYMLAAFFSTTMGPSFRVDINSLDPKDREYVLGNY